MKARVNTYLNVRTGTPEILPDNNPNNAFFNPNDVVEIVETIVGEEYKGNDIWHKLDTGVLVSNFGVDIDKSLFFKENTPINIDNDLSKKIILNAPMGKNGKGITIGILDSGIDTGHPDLKAALIGQEEDCLILPHEGNIINSHGTKVAGILAGNNPIISGLAIDAKIRSFRVIGNDEFTDELALQSALQKIINENINIDILNLSLNISDGSVSFFQPLIDQICSRGTLIFVAGNEVSINQVNAISRLKNVIVIGVFSENEFQQIQNSASLALFHCFFLNFPIVTTGLLSGENNHVSFSSSSAYTALTSGVAAKYLSNKVVSRDKRFTEFTGFIKSSSLDIKKEKQPIPFKFYKS